MNAVEDAAGTAVAVRDDADRRLPKGGPAYRPFVSLLEQAAAEEGVRVRWLEGDWVARLSKDGQVHWIHGLYFPLNSTSSCHIARDKVATFQLLDDANVPAVAHYLVRAGWADFDDSGLVDGVLDRVDPPLVVKPMRGAGGTDVTKVETRDEARLIVEELATRHRAIVVSPFESITSEHRVVVLDGEVLLCYRKVLLNRGEWRFNLKFGALPVAEDSPALLEEMAEVALPAMKAIGGRFMCVDIVSTARGKRVIEVNGSVTLSRFATLSLDYWLRSVDVYRKAVRRCFEPAGA